MKKVIVVLMFFVLQSIAFAQSPIDKGSFTIGGNISYSSENYDNGAGDYSAFRINPQFGYFIIDNFYAALSINYMSYSTDRYKQSSIGIGPAIRYYFSSEKIKPFLGVGFTYNENSFENENDKVTSTEIKMTGGLDYFVTDYLALEASINYSALNYKYPISGLSYSTLKVNSKLFQIAVGVNYFIY